MTITHEQRQRQATAAAAELKKTGPMGISKAFILYRVTENQHKPAIKYAWYSIQSCVIFYVNLPHQPAGDLYNSFIYVEANEYCM